MHRPADVELHVGLVGRIGTAADVADTVAFLLPPAAAFINGVVLPVDGGRANGSDPEAV